ncbi:hypothetical protein SUGI_0891270 [Cryptomeria japonica]|nr:hypothetical protein SUGI_0891270 [Cryptomeria japonica]
MRSGTCSFSGFSIRRYVAEVRQRDVEKCCPFHPQLSKSRLKQGTTSQLPSHEENVIQLQDKSEQQIDISEDNIVTHGQVNEMCKLEIVVPYCVNNQNPDGQEDKSTFHPREDGTYERREEDGTNEKWACHLSGGIKSEEIFSENNINKKNPELEAKSPCFLREDETKENWAQNKTNENRAEGETNEGVAEEETNEKHAAYQLSEDIKSGFFLPKKCVNKQKSDLESKSLCLLREDETNEKAAEDETKEKREEGKTNKGVAEESNEKWTAHHLSGDIKSEEILSERNINKQIPEVEAKSPCLSGHIKSKEILSENKANQQAQSLAFGSSDPVIGGFAVHSSDSIVAKLKTDVRPHIHSFPKGTRLCTSKILLNEMFSPGKFAKGIISREGTQIHCSFQTCREENSKRYATRQGNKIASKEQDMNGQGKEQISAKMLDRQGDSSNYRKRALELPPGANGQQSQKKKPSAISNIDQGPQKKEQVQSERSNIAILALPAFQCNKA